MCIFYSVLFSAFLKKEKTLRSPTVQHLEIGASSVNSRDFRHCLKYLPIGSPMTRHPGPHSLKSQQLVMIRL